jgi:threonylcarbamoyladenosine tRNA methylthiotransferase MtaB
MADVDAAADTTQEVVLTGVHLGSWGHDLSPASSLHHLVRAILEETSVTRLRLSSLEPWDLDEDFFTLWEDPRLCRHLHLPLQSGCAATLRRMARKTTPPSFRALVAAARRSIPEIAITTDIIVGFPGETDGEFAESLAFVQEMGFSGGHVFTYSARPGTAAERMPGQIPFELRKKRSAQMRSILADSAAAYQACFLGRVLPVLWESTTAVGPEGWQLSGLTDNYLRVNAQGPQHIWNRITPVKLTGFTEDGILGKMV